MTSQTKGTICGIIAAVSYGTNPLGALYLYQVGVNADSVLFYRYTLAAVILMALMKVKKIPFAINIKELSVIGGLGCIPYHGGCHHGDIFSRKNHFLDHAFHIVGTKRYSYAL